MALAQSMVKQRFESKQSRFLVEPKFENRTRTSLITLDWQAISSLKASSNFGIGKIIQDSWKVKQLKVLEQLLHTHMLTLL